MSDETVLVPAALVEKLRSEVEAWEGSGRAYDALSINAVAAARALVDAATPAASVPAADILALAQQMEDVNTEHGTMPRVRMQVRREWAARLRALTTPPFDPYAEIREDMREDERQRFVAAAEQIAGFRAARLAGEDDRP